MPGRTPAAATEQSSPFERKYHVGETAKYRIQMTHLFDGAVTSTYDARAIGVVKSDDKGFFEEFQWTSVISDGKSAVFSQEGNKFRQVLSLAPPFRLTIPEELPKLDSFMIGPITDLLTFYVDESLAIREPPIRKPGDHVYLNSSVAASWGSGRDCINFDITLLALDQPNKIGTIKVSHLPPPKICIKPPSKWMEMQVTDIPNNWYDLNHSDMTKWEAAVGKETFDVVQTADLSTGMILSATMDNPVVFQSRDCSDEQLANCSAPTNHKIVRKLTLTRE